MTGSLTVGRVRGIPIRAHFTLLVVLPYVAFLMAARLPEVARAAGVTADTLVLPPLALGLALAVGLFACVLLHELGHALVALHHGGHVAGITLMLLGGVTELGGLPRSPRIEGTVAVAGPIVSAVIGALALIAHGLLPLPPDARFALFYLGQMNLVLAVFNLLPAFPMDGGRVLRAVLSAWLPWTRATRVAAATGMVFAGGFVALGLLSGNLVLGLIGLFVWAGARSEADGARREDELGGLFVRDVMSPVRASVASADSVATAIARLLETQAHALPVVDGPSVRGIVALRHLEQVEASEVDATPVSSLLEAKAPRLHAGEVLSVALARMEEQGVAEAPVLEEGRVVGVLEPGDLSTALRLRRLVAASSAGRTRGLGIPARGHPSDGTLG